MEPKNNCLLPLFCTQADNFDTEAHLAATDIIQEYPLFKTTCHRSATEPPKTADMSGISAVLSDPPDKVVHLNTTERSNQPPKKNPEWRSKHERLKGQPSSTMPRLVLAKKKLTWQLMMEGYSTYLTLEEQRRTLRQAFRMWSEVTPLIFMEVSPKSQLRADITLGFGTGTTDKIV